MAIAAISNISKHKNENSSIRFTDNGLKFDVVVTENHPQHILREATHLHGVIHFLEHPFWGIYSHFYFWFHLSLNWTCFFFLYAIISVCLSSCLQKSSTLQKEISFNSDDVSYKWILFLTHFFHLHSFHFWLTSAGTASLCQTGLFKRIFTIQMHKNDWRRDRKTARWKDSMPTAEMQILSGIRMTTFYSQVF